VRCRSGNREGNNLGVDLDGWVSQREVGDRQVAARGGHPDTDSALAFEAGVVVARYGKCHSASAADAAGGGAGADKCGPQEAAVRTAGSVERVETGGEVMRAVGTRVGCAKPGCQDAIAVDDGAIEQFELDGERRHDDRNLDDQLFELPAVVISVVAVCVDLDGSGHRHAE
jgi:hypothetical protein